MQACLSQPLPDLQPVAQLPDVDLDATQRTAAPVVPPRSRVQPAPAVGPTVRQSKPQPKGSDGPQIFCANCGRGNKGTARFCATCGTPLQPAPATSLPPATPAQPARSVTPAPSPAPTLPPALFRVTTPRGSWEFPLLTLPCRIGRRDPSQNHYPELDLADYDRGHASRRHAVVERRGDQYVLTDVGSVNGTILNGVTLPAHRPQALREDDRIKIGDVELRFTWA